MENYRMIEKAMVYLEHVENLINIDHKSRLTDDEHLQIIDIVANLTDEAAGLFYDYIDDPKDKHISTTTIHELARKTNKEPIEIYNFLFDKGGSE